MFIVGPSHFIQFFFLSLGWIFYQFRLNWRYQTHSSNDTLPLSTFQSFDATKVILISIENKCSMSFIGHWSLPITYQSAEVKLELLRFILNITRKCIWIAFDQKPLGSFAFTHMSAIVIMYADSVLLKWNAAAPWMLILFEKISAKFHASDICVYKSLKW